jgi:hypothetical protein
VTHTLVDVRCADCGKKRQVERHGSRPLPKLCRPCALKKGGKWSVRR